MFEPVGARRASWSKVRHSPPASESSDGQLRNFGKTLVVKNGANCYDDLGIVGVRLASLFNDARDGNWGTVDLWRLQALISTYCNKTRLYAPCFETTF